MGETLEETEAEHWVPLVHGEMAGEGRSTVDGGRWSSKHGGGVVPVGFGRGRANGRVGVGGAGLWWRVDGGVSSSEFKRGGGGILKWWSTEKAKGREE